MLKRIPETMIWYHPDTTVDWFFGYDTKADGTWINSQANKHGFDPRYIIITRYIPGITEILDLLIINRDKTVGSLRLEF